MFRKPKKKPSALRGAAASGGGGGGASNSGGGAPSTGGGSSANKKRNRRRRHSSSSDEDNNSNDDDDDEEGGTSGILQQIRKERESNSAASTTLLNTSSTSTKKKKSKKGNNDDSSSNNWMHQYKSTDNQMSAQEMATRTAEYHPSEGKQATTNEEASKNASLAAINTKQPRNAFHAGPLRAATFVRTTARFDYQPDICKDYKETGFCGFGDTCIYLHDRGDTKTGWQMEQEYEEKKKKDSERKGREMEMFMESMMCDGEIKKSNGGKSGGGTTSFGEGNNNAVDGGMEDDGIPFACHLCRSHFQNPIVTPCGHYFCEKCMLQQIKEEGGSTGCPICKKDTHGVMNHPQKLVAKKRRLVGRDGTWEEYLERSKG